VVTAHQTDTDPQTAQRVLREQVAALYAASWSSTLADTLLAWALCAVFYWRLHNPMVPVWFGLHFMQLLRYPLLSAYHRDPLASERSAFWAHRQARELLIYSCVWGLAPWLFMPADNLPMTALLMLIMMGISSAGVPAVAPRWQSVLSFVVPMMAGLISALAWRGDGVHLFLAVCCLLYLGATLHFARQQHLLLNNALLMRFEKESLAEKLSEQIVVAQRASEEKNRFFAAANHDLRQPLHAIALFGAVLEKELQGRPEHTHATRLMRAVHALSGSLDTMLDVSRLDAGVIVPSWQAMPLNPLFQVLNQLFASRAEEKGLQLRLRASPLWVRTDPHLLQRLLANLLENAIKYTTQGGVLVVARARGESVWIEVLDTGIGMAPEHIASIFDEFYQINNPGRDRTQGLGIGLSIVRRLSELLGHPVTVQSHLGRGSRFRVVVPLAPAQDLLPTVNAQALPERRALPKRILLIEDEADIAQAMGALLASYGVDFQAAQNEVEATATFSQAAAHGHPFETLICDYRLADGANGLDAARRLRDHFAPNLPLLLVTGETAPDRLQRVRDSGVPVLFKPVTAETLISALASLRRKS
jgi:signal transduction histidine kinase